MWFKFATGLAVRSWFKFATDFFHGMVCNIVGAAVALVLKGTDILKGKRTSFEKSACAIARSVGEIGDWWSLLIVRNAFYGTRRFSDFQKRLGLAKNILAARLKKLVDERILEMIPASDGTVYQEYVLTEKGRDLHVIIVALWQWGEKHTFEPGELKASMVDSKRHEVLPPLVLKAVDGRELDGYGFEWQQYEATQ
jgi:DNA-binding HxlR family transcriptional regulator